MCQPQFKFWAMGSAWVKCLNCHAADDPYQYEGRDNVGRTIGRIPELVCSVEDIDHEIKH